MAILKRKKIAENTKEIDQLDGFSSPDKLLILAKNNN